MDKTLERIMSLFPRNDKGGIARGSSKELADHLGLPISVITDWKAGRNKSYKRYLHEIAAKYGVSVEWLKGETDEKRPFIHADEEALNEELISRLVSLTPDEMKQVDAFVQGLLANR